MKVKGYLLFILLMPVILAFGEKITPSFKFENLTNENGLSQSSVTSIIQDSREFIWIGTRNGLNKYDGYEFTIYQHDAKKKGSISDNSISCLLIDRQDRFWIGTDAGGLLLYDEKMDVFIPFDQIAGQKGQQINDIAHAFQDSKGILWICTIRNGLIRWDESNHTIQKFVHDEQRTIGLRSNYLKQVFEDREGRLWLLSDSGIDQILEQKDSIVFKSFDYSKNLSYDLPSVYAKKMIQDEEGKIWIASDGGLSQLDPQTGKCINYQKDPLDINSLSNNFVKDICIAQKGELWIATDQGINVFDLKKKSFIHIQKSNSNRSLLSNYVKSFYKSKDGAIWIATDGGVSIYDEMKEQFGLLLFQDLNNNITSGGNVYAIYRDQNYLWVGTDTGLFIKNLLTNELSNYVNNPANLNSISNDLVKTITKDDRGNYWIGTDGGFSKVYLNDAYKIVRFENFTIDDKHSVNNVRSMLEDDQHHLWIGTWGGGLVKFDLIKHELVKNWGGMNFEDYGLSSSIVWKIIRDSKERMWVVTSRGINLYDKKTDHFESFMHDADNPTSLSSPRPICMLEDKEGNFWIGTTGGGLNKFDPQTRIFESMDSVEDIGSKAIYAIMEDANGKLWMSTSDGIVSYDPKTKLSKKYGVSNGLQGKEYNIDACFKSKNGLMYFGGLNGLNYFNPYTMEENFLIPKVYITEFQLFNKTYAIDPDGILDQSIWLTHSMELKYDENVFSFKFVGLNFRNSLKNLYAYKLEGFDRDWQYTTQKNRQANYTQVPPGDYTFKVKASNDDAHWNEEGVTLAITIAPPWWLSNWAKLICVFLFVLGGPGLYLSRVKRLKNEAHALEEEVEQRVSEIKLQKEIIEERNFELHTAHEQIHLKNISLEDLNATLEEKVAVRTVALSEVVAELKDRNVNLEQFNYIISHNMRAPVANMVGLLQLYNYQNPSDPFNTELINKLQMSCNKLDEVLKDLTKILEVHHQIDRPRVEIKFYHLIGDIMSAIEKEIEKSKVEFIMDLKVETVFSVRPLWYSIFMNLISNAIKYRQNDVPLIISISTIPTEKGTKIIFKDNGIGIDLATNRDKIFGLYKRFHTHVEGKGMGLFMTKTQIESLGGTINIQSVPNQGTTFEIEF